MVPNQMAQEEDIEGHRKYLEELEGRVEFDWDSNFVHGRVLWGIWSLEGTCGYHSVQ